MDYQAMAFQFLGGLGLFLFSIKYMGDGLQMAAGDRLKYVLDKYTTNPFLGVLTGIFVTVLLQSSSGATVITVGLVAAGLLNLKQAIGIVMGANIGTTVTSFIIGFNLSAYALPVIFLGAVLLFFTKKQLLNNIGRILFGIGGIFYALSLMSHAMVPLRSLDSFKELTIALSKSPILGVFVGTVLTVIIQSSAATIGILQALYSQHIMNLQAALPVLFGDNIGTTITAIIAALASNKAAKRVAASHVLFNLIGTIIFLVFLSPFTQFIQHIENSLALDPKLTIAFSHGMFNFVNVLIQFPFIGLLAYIVTKLIPFTEEEIVYKPQYLDKLLISNSPVVAIGAAKKEISVMFQKAIANLDRATMFFQTRDIKLSEKASRKEEEINSLDQEIAKYITLIFQEHLTEKQNDEGTSLLDTTRDIERIADHAIGLIHDVEYQIRKNLVYSEIAKEEVSTLTRLSKEMLEITLIAFNSNDKNKAIEVLDLHNKVYAYEKKIRKNHISRLSKEQCEIKAGLYYVDVISHFTRICDHARNIAEKIINNQIIL